MMIYPLTTNGDPQLGLLLSRYGILLEQADLSSITPKMFEMLFCLNGSIVTRADPRTALVTSVATAIQEQDDLDELKCLGVDTSLLDGAYGGLDELLALQHVVQSLDMLQCVALFERIEEVTVLSENESDYSAALALVYRRLVARIF